MLPTTFCSNSNGCSSSYPVPVLKHVYTHFAHLFIHPTSSPIDFHGSTRCKLQGGNQPLQTVFPNISPQKKHQAFVDSRDNGIFTVPIDPTKTSSIHVGISIVPMDPSRVFFISCMFSYIQGPGGGKFPTLVEEICVFFKMVEIDLPQVVEVGKRKTATMSESTTQV